MASTGQRRTAPARCSRSSAARTPRRPACRRGPLAPGRRRRRRSRSAHSRPGREPGSPACRTRPCPAPPSGSARAAGRALRTRSRTPRRTRRCRIESGGGSRPPRRRAAWPGRRRDLAPRSDCRHRPSPESIRARRREARAAAAFGQGSRETRGRYRTYGAAWRRSRAGSAAAARCRPTGQGRSSTTSRRGPHWRTTSTPRPPRPA
mmetsp:Transcript_12994/g.32436  ORF Transcript_12994/g.32436 Transcript_12994/m.32436 type:complete len:206 (-) Transcript_12994:22-639(-)